MPLQTNCAAFKAAESLGADFVECLNRTAEIGAAVVAVSYDFYTEKLRRGCQRFTRDRSRRG